jgi:hypothetical protein
MIDDVRYNPKWNGDPAKYLEAKLKVLEDPRGFGVHPTKEEIEHLRTLKTQTAIDNGILTIIDRRWG